jgi:hypothetical protein
MCYAGPLPEISAAVEKQPAPATGETPSRKALYQIPNAGSGNLGQSEFSGWSFVFAATPPALGRN